MTSRKSTKINNLLRIWPKGTLAVQAWLERQGIYRQLANTYCQNQWLLRLDHGVYQQTGDNVEWPGAIYCLQHQLQLKVHLGALTALELNSASHYLPFGEKIKYLFINVNEHRKIPVWFKKHYGKPGTFSFIKSNLFSGDCSLGLQALDMGSFDITISSLERAIIESLYLVPKQMSLEHAYYLMEKLRTLRPHVLQQLLEKCQSIKVKRLFLYLAELQKQPWFKQLNPEKIYLGKGARKIGDGGNYVAKYLISVPNIEKLEGYP